MKKLIVLLAALGLAHSASAVQIDGNITIAGGATLDGPIGSANSVTSWVAPEVISRDGDFAGFVAVGDAVTMTAPWVFDPSTATADLWAVGGFEFDLASSAIAFQSTTFLAIGGVGTVSGNGFDATAGIWNFTTQTPHSGGVFSFSASTDTRPQDRIPDGGTTILLLGLSLAGLGLIRRKIMS